MTDGTKKRIAAINTGIIPKGYKKTKVGIVPAEWTIEKFFSFCDVVNGGTPNTEISDYWNGNIFWCTPTDITNSGKYIDKTDKKITLKGLKNSSANLLPVNSILMCSRATIGPRSINTVPMATNQGFKSLIVDKKKADLLFINEILELCVPIFIRKSCGSTFLELSKKDVGNQLIPFPPLSEQQKIAEILSTQDKLIELYERKIEQLKTLKKGYLQNMFPKKGAKSPELRFKGFTEPWEQRKLSDMVERVTRKNENLESELPLTISAQYGLIDQNKFFDKRIASRDVSGYYLLKKGEFAYNKSTSSDAPWGAVKRLDRYEMGVLSTLYIVFALKKDGNIDSDFLVSYYDTDCWHKGVQAIAAEGARNHGLLNITPADYFETVLTVPSNVKEQHQIGTFFAKLDSLITLHQHKLDKEKQKKKALMQLLLTGKVRVIT